MQGEQATPWTGRVTGPGTVEDGFVYGSLPGPQPSGAHDTRTGDPSAGDPSAGDPSADPRGGDTAADDEPPASPHGTHARTDAAITDPAPPRVPIASGATVGRPTSSQAAYARSLRALATLNLPHPAQMAADPAEMAADPAEMAADPAQMARRRWVAAGTAPGFALPGVMVAELAYAQAVDWMLCAALADLERPGRGGYYFRLSERPVDQAPFEAARERLSDAVLRRQVLTGAYRLRSGGTGTRRGARRPKVQIAAVGPTVAEALEAATALENEGICAHVVEVTSADAAYGAWQRAARVATRTGSTPALVGVMRQAFDLEAPLVTVHDQGPQPLVWLGSALGLPALPVVVPETGSHDDLVEAIGHAALAALGL